MARKADSHHVLPLFCDDLIASCVDMSPACFGAYVRLLCYAWTRGSVPDDASACGRIAGGMDSSDWAAIRSRLTPVVGASQCDRSAIADGSQSDRRLTHPRLELERQAVEQIREKKSEAGRKGNVARWGSQTDRKPIANGIANGSQSDRKTIAPNPSPSLPIREEDIPAAPVPTSDPATPSRSRAKPVMSWDADAGWQGVTDADRSEWATAFPGAVLDTELAKATAWLRANPKRCGKRNWRRFLVGWLQRCQDKGGTNREVGNRPSGPPPSDPAKRRYYRSDAGRNMTDAEYAAWRRDQRTGGTATALAQSLRLSGEDR